MATYDVSGIFHLEVEAKTEVEARRELARRLHVAGVQYYIMDSQLVRRDTDGNKRQRREHKTGQHESDRG